MLKTCFLNPRNVTEEVRSICETKMVGSTNALIDELLRPGEIAPFYPREAIISEEVRQAEIQRRAAAEEERRQRENVRLQTKGGGGCLIS